MDSSTALIKQMYAKNLEAQKANLEQDYNKSVANLQEQQIANQKATDTKLNRNAVEAQRARNNFAETQNAYGLTSGAAAQARLAQQNTELANMTALRAKQQEADAQAERQRGLLADQYNAAIREAQATNDYKLAEALYKDAKASTPVYYGGGGSKSGTGAAGTAGTAGKAGAAGAAAVGAAVGAARTVNIGGMAQDGGAYVAAQNALGDARKQADSYFGR